MSTPANAIDWMASGGGSPDDAPPPKPNAIDWMARGGGPKDKPLDTSREVTDGPLGLINGVAGLAGKAILNAPYVAASGVQDLYRMWNGTDPKAPDSGIVDALHFPLNQNEQNVASSITGTPTVSGVKSAVSTVADQDFPLPEKEKRVLGDVAKIAPVVGAGTNALRRFVGGEAAVPAAVEATSRPTAQSVADQAAARQSGGAAGASSNVSEASLPLQSRIAEADPAKIDSVVMRRHLDADKLPMPEGTSPLQLRKGQATADSQQISDEKNLRADPDTNGILTASIEDQDKKLVGSMGEIRRQATPEIVQRNNQEHGQAAVDEIRSDINQGTLDTRAKYKALSDANGGNIPIDTGSAIGDIDAKLQKGYLTKTAANNGVVSSIMDDLRSGNPISFESFENARSRLAEVQRAGGSDAAAAGIVRGSLEGLPLPPEAAPLKGLADQARSAAAAQFEKTRRNPAYKAVAEENAPKDSAGLHIIGSDSPLADSFMDRFALGNGPNASKAYVQRLKEAVPSPVLSQSMEAATLNKLRDAAGIDANGNGSFRNDSYRNMHNALEPKMDALLSPQSIEHTELLKRVGGYVNDEGKASSVNRSNTALTLQRFGAQYPASSGIAGDLADKAGDIAASHLGPVGLVGKKIGQTMFKASQDAKAIQSIKDAKLKFAQDAVAPGAGIER